MGKMKSMITDREEDLLTELRDITEVINTSVDNGEGAEERRGLYDRADQVRRLLNELGVEA